MIDLTKILKDCPKGWKFYSSVLGEVSLKYIIDDAPFPIIVTYNNGNNVCTEGFKANGKMRDCDGGECVLFPSKDQRDWSKFKAPVKKFDYSILKPFDKVLVRNSDSHSWRANFLSHIDCGVVYCVNMVWGQTIPYNDETKHLVGTTDMPDEKYIWWK